MKRLTFILLALLLCLSLQAQDSFAVPFCKKGLFSSEQTVTHTGYVTSWNELKGTPNWVAWELTRTEAEGQTASRKDEDFLPDPMVKKSPVTQDYSRSGYDRGHMAPAADFKWSATAMTQSFYLSNVCPQNRELNSGLWLELEQKCRVWAKKYGSVYICAGPLFAGNLKTIGNYHIWVPSAFFKAIAVKMNGQWKCIAFVMDNAALDNNADILDCTISVKQLEMVTGMTFFPEMDDSKAKEILDKNSFTLNWKKR